MNNSTIAITGASSGIGRAAALHLAGLGHYVVLASEHLAGLKEVQEQIIDFGGRAEVLQLELLDPEAVERFYDSVVARVGFCPILINNAGVGLHKTLEDSSDEEFYRVFAINFFSIVTICRSAIKVMKEHGQGHIINVSSASARRCLEKMSAYGASKAAVHGFSQALRAEVDGYGIAVTEILPISVSTPFFSSAGYQPKGLVQSPEHIAYLIEKAIRYRTPEICSSWLTSLGFAIDALAPNWVERGFSLMRRFRA